MKPFRVLTSFAPKVLFLSYFRCRQRTLGAGVVLGVKPSISISLSALSRKRLLGGKMPLKKGVYIIECVPQKDDMREGALLYEFLNMVIPNRIEYDDVKSKIDFFDKLITNNSKVVHISCHGNMDYNEEFYMAMPKGNIYPDEFYESDRLKGRNVVITGCFLGRKDFADEFLERTQADSLIAPMNEIDFHDSAMWCVNFYYHLFTRSSFSCSRSYDYMSKNFYVPGAMQMWI